MVEYNIQGFWSSVLHVCILFVYKFGMYKKDVFSMVLFFCHQCNGTHTFVTAMMMLIHKQKDDMNNMTTSRTLYNVLCEICSSINDKPFNISTSKDVGSSIYNRFQTSNSGIYKDKDVLKCFEKMNYLFMTYTKKMSSIRDRHNVLQKLQLYVELKTEIAKDDTFAGFKTVRVDHFICMSSLIGLLPLDYYVNVPMHMSGGPREFLIRSMNIENQLSNLEGDTIDEKLCRWTDQKMKELNRHYSKELTPNMIENCSCIIGRGRPKRDVFYCLPWYDHKLDKISYTSHIQLMFKLEGFNTNSWHIEVYDGFHLHIFASSTNPLLNKLSFHKSTEGYIKDEVCHLLDKDWLQQLYTK